MDIAQTASFNSMKVRLKLTKTFAQYYLRVFQFHEGPIKTEKEEALTRYLSPFQFHEGPIKTQQASDVNDFANVSIP